MIILVGTSHVSEQSSRDARAAIAEADIVAIELDSGRAAGLLSNERASFTDLRKALGVRAAVIASILRYVQEKVAASAGVMPGVEMRAALEEATKRKKPIVLIDRDVRITISRLSKNVGWPEFRQMLRDLFKRRKIELHPSEDLVTQLMAELKHTYPRVYKVMVSERDVYMAHQLVSISNNNPDTKIVAIVGMGHVAGLRRQINYLNAHLEVIAWSSPAPSTKQSSHLESSRA